eukprot:ANDGO_06588.mRNA.1 Vacuolar protein sorting-associated protein 28 homolog 2
MISTDRVKLASNRNEREYYDALADMFALIHCIEHLEKAYTRDALSQDSYAQQCAKLLSQYKLLSSSLGDKWSLDQFVAEYSVSAPTALRRLRVGVPATTEFRAVGSSTIQTKQVAETVQFFITVMDSLKLDMNAVDQLFPLVQDLVEALSKSSSFLPMEYEKHTRRLQDWFTKMNAMRATETLSSEDVRQLMFDLDTAYTEFHKALSA